MEWDLKTLNVNQLFLLLINKKVEIVDFEKAMKELHYEVLLPKNRDNQQGFYSDFERNKILFLLRHLQTFNEKEKVRIKKFLDNPIWKHGKENLQRL